MFGIVTAGISLIGSACAAVSTICSTLGTGLVSAGKVIINAIQVGLPIAEKVFRAVDLVAKAWGIFTEDHKEEDLYDLGMRAEQASMNGMKSDNFDSYQEYIDHLRADIELKPNLSLSDEDKLKYGALGTAVAIKGISDKYQVEIPDSFWLSGVNMNFQPEQFKPLLDAFESEKVVPKLEDFNKGKLPFSEHEKIYDVLESYLGESMTAQEVEQFFVDAKKNSA
ncbi:hypothetical protein CWB89_10260 [Pseudoalteromonas piscicida]|uniref:Uncharacterized protein n=2 Tax=Pseudoalteromonas TaxID=53246 RepID=A0AAQ2EQJ0_PSEO7|nr:MULTISPECIES: hypothetical protein [Pseudoalteromonas]KJY87697.1 hypothetical protein TW75_14180 [Pseudoalteromonas piscicida]TMN33333.1 hypothetical protein CWB95_22870 [Pseudoalteromonas piscicida]TMN39104.1 hypothetical protein CWB94_11680 [Pseudoalteromonas piscicida]TMN52379.1 hypothetical protein CWB91_11355 [Pseudoalteromonas piscicida]TMN54357.1 hypothetical protein CWB92_06910 [Pseudoalteromonas piscicida]